ncbi:MAG: serine/threonine-protein kinase [Anaerolineae bacterium]|jgi:WD40 repeat protein/tRNA A-37 threonylcarbamoyl transferase component Bud32|nr:serine/threonine-protein kinase [Anaerolineae bacterium]
MQDFINQQIDRYRITERLGQGGMAVVYRAYDTRLMRDVAIKFIRTGEIPESQHDRIRKRFEQEARMQARFSHPNIVPAFDYGEYEGTPYLVLACVTGGTLKDRFEGAMPLKKALEILTPIADAVAYAHSMGVLHRDIKPSNILFSQEGTPMLTDFGIAKLLETTGATLTGTGLGVGTAEYMAPEQWQGKATQASDQYALGVVLYELLTGQKPFTAENPLAVAMKQLNEPLPRPSALNPAIPEELERILFKVLNKDPLNRFTSMAEFHSVLQRFRSGEKVDLPYLPELEEDGTSIQPITDTDNEGQTFDRWHEFPEERNRAQVSRNAKSLTKPFKKGRMAAILGGILLVVVLLAVILKPDFLSRNQPEESPSGNTASLAEGAQNASSINNETSLTSQEVEMEAGADSQTNPAGFVTELGSEVISINNLTNLTDLGRLGNGKLADILWTSDGSELVIASSIGVHFYDARDLIETTLSSSDSSLTCVAISPDGNLLAAGSSDGIVYLFDAITGETVRKIKGHSDYVSDVAFSFDGRILASLGAGGDLKLWDAASGDVISILDGQVSNLWSIAFSPKSLVLATGSNVGDRSSNLWDPDNEFTDPGGDGAVRLWDISSGELLHILWGEGRSSIRSVAFSPDGATLAAGSEGAIRLYDVASGASLSPLEGHTTFVNRVVFSPDGDTLASGDGYGGIRIWDARSGATIHQLQAHTGFVNMLAFSQDGSVLVSGDGSGKINLWDVNSGELTETLDWHTSDVLALAFSPDGSALASGGKDGLVHLWDVQSASILYTLNGNLESARNVHFTPDGKNLAVKDWQGRIDLWDVASGNLARSMEANVGMAISPDGRTVASGNEGIIYLRDIGTDAILQTFEWQTNTMEWQTADVVSLDFSPNGKTLASGGKYGPIRLWDVESGELISTFEGHQNSVHFVAFSPDGSKLASASEDQTLRVWDLASGFFGIYEGHGGLVNSAAISSDNTVLVSGGKDGTIRLWNLASSDPIRTLDVHQGSVNDVDFSSDGTLLASGSSDGTIRLWGIP